MISLYCVTLCLSIVLPEFPAVFIVPEGDVFTLDCTPSAPTQITFQRNGVEVQSGSPVLSFATTVGDSGVYSCRGFGGDVSSSNTTLVVFPGEVGRGEGEGRRKGKEGGGRVGEGEGGRGRG